MKKRIVCFGDSNTWGVNAATGERFSDQIRWTCLLEQMMGPDYQIIEEGLSGRTSVMEDPLFEGLNGFTYIHPCLMSHSPVELVIVMLGTNDVKERFHLTANNVAQGIFRLAKKICCTPAGDGGKAPKLLVVAPPPIGSEYKRIEVFQTMGRDCDKKSANFPVFLETYLQEVNIPYLNTIGKVKMNQIDYMHLDEIGHRNLALEIHTKINEIL